jgi:hypothetical protein
MHVCKAKTCFRNVPMYTRWAELGEHGEADQYHIRAAVVNQLLSELRLGLPEVGFSGAWAKETNIIYFDSMRPQKRNRFVTIF